MNQQAKVRQNILSYADIKHSMRFLSFFGTYTAPLYEFTLETYMHDYLPLMLLSEGIIYQADAMVEAAQKDELEYVGLQPWFERKAELMAIAQEIGAYSPEYEADADGVTAYWQVEDRMMVQGELTHELVVQAINLRVNDIMMMHHLCHHAAQKPYDADVWATLRVFEEIRDIEADLIEYQADVASRDFNVYRMFVKLYGAEGATHIEHELCERKERYQTMVAALPDQDRTAFEELTRLYYLGRPNRPIPAPILE